VRCVGGVVDTDSCRRVTWLTPALMASTCGLQSWRQPCGCYCLVLAPCAAPLLGAAQQVQCRLLYLVLVCSRGATPCRCKVLWISSPLLLLQPFVGRVQRRHVQPPGSLASLRVSSKTVCRVGMVHCRVFSSPSCWGHCNARSTAAGTGMYPCEWALLGVWLHGLSLLLGLFQHMSADSCAAASGVGLVATAGRL
jgi:hypothetical protein